MSFADYVKQSDQENTRTSLASGTILSAALAETNVSSSTIPRLSVVKSFQEASESEILDAILQQALIDVYRGDPETYHLFYPNEPLPDVLPIYTIPYGALSNLEIPKDEELDAMLQQALIDVYRDDPEAYRMFHPNNPLPDAIQSETASHNPQTISSPSIDERHLLVRQQVQPYARGGSPRTHNVSPPSTPPRPALQMAPTQQRPPVASTSSINERAKNVGQRVRSNVQMGSPKTHRVTPPSTPPRPVLQMAPTQQRPPVASTSSINERARSVGQRVRSNVQMGSPKTHRVTPPSTPPQPVLPMQDISQRVLAALSDYVFVPEPTSRNDNTSHQHNRPAIVEVPENMDYTLSQLEPSFIQENQDTPFETKELYTLDDSDESGTLMLLEPSSLDDVDGLSDTPIGDWTVYEGEYVRMLAIKFK